MELSLAMVEQRRRQQKDASPAPPMPSLPEATPAVAHTYSQVVVLSIYMYTKCCPACQMTSLFVGKHRRVFMQSHFPAVDEYGQLCAAQH